MNQFDRKKLPARPRIVLIKLRSIGDVIYNTSVYAPLKRSFPGAHLTVVVEPPAYDIVCNHPDVDEVLRFEKNGLWKPLKFYLDLFRARFDVAIDMHEGPRGAVMCFLTRAGFRVGNRFAKRAFLYNVKLDFSDLSPRYPMDYQVALIRKMGVEFDRPSPSIHISEDRKRGAFRLLECRGINSEEPLCIIHPGTRKLFDQWQFEKFARVAETLRERQGIQILFTCGPGEENQVRSVLNHIKTFDPVFLQAGLQEWGAILQRARFVLCHDSGFMHLAAAMGTPVISLFGWTNPRVWKPMGDHSVVIYKQLECSPCNRWTRRDECNRGDPECKRLITVEEVLDQIERVLSISRESTPGGKLS